MEVPDCYEDHIIEDWMELTAHAPVLVPQGENHAGLAFFAPDL